jgi:hypothetical protein
MDILTAVNAAASRLRAADTNDVATASGTGSAHPAITGHPLTALVHEAADTAETAALALLHLGAIDDAPAYLSTANAFAQVRDELDHPGVAPPVKSPLTTPLSKVRDLGSTDVLAVEAALADLAAALLTTLAAASGRLTDPAAIVMLSRASLAATDAYHAIHRDTTDARHIR